MVRPFLIGLETERRDKAMLARQTSVESFLSFDTFKACLVGMRHRNSALEDSRLLSLPEIPQ
jgi:hypothetical protein